MDSVLGWHRRLQQGSDQARAFQELMQQPDQLSRFIKEAQLSRDDDALDPFREYLADAVEISMEEEWRPALECYEAILRRIQQQQKVDRSRWFYWDNLIEIRHKAGDIRRAVDLTIERMRDGKGSDFYKAHDMFWDLFNKGNLEPLHKLAAAALRVASESGSPAYGFHHVVEWLELLGPRAALVRALEAAGQHSRAAKVYEIMGKTGMAAEICRRIGRNAKAQRLEGSPSFDTEEVDFPRGETWKDAFSSATNSSLLCKDGSVLSTSKGRELYEDGRRQEAAAFLEEAYFGNPWPPSVRGYRPAFAIAGIYDELGDTTSTERVLHTAEAQLRAVGLWADALGMYYDAKRLGDLERVAREEDELECAAIAYEAAGISGEAARIYEEMAGTGPNTGE